MAHRYQAGDRVFFNPGFPSVKGYAGLYVVLRQLPITNCVAHYRIQSSLDGHERVAAEGELAAAPAS
jgi:hypothetical protein